MAGVPKPGTQKIFKCGKCKQRVHAVYEPIQQWVFVNHADATGSKPCRNSGQLV